MQLIEYPLQYWKSGGVLIVPLVFTCWGIWYYFLSTRRRLLAAIAEANSVAGVLREGQLSELQKRDGALFSFVRQWIASRISSASSTDLLDKEWGRMASVLKKDVVILTALTTVAPLLGLIGTVVGMMQTFNAVSAVSSEVSMRVASGVSRALITTQVGLVVAIPGVFGIARLRRLSEHLQVSMGAVKLHALLWKGAQE